jgi:hypothetical protein
MEEVVGVKEAVEGGVAGSLDNTIVARNSRCGARASQMESLQPVPDSTTAVPASPRRVGRHRREPPASTADCHHHHWSSLN